MSQSQVARPSARQIAAAATLVGAVALVGWLGRDDRAGTDVSVVGAIGLEEVSQQVGVEFLHRRPMLDPKLDNVAPHVAGIGAAVSIVDVDRDGWPDIYFTSSRIGDSNALFHNNQDGTFSDIAGEVGLADVNRRGEGASMGAVWGDIDNDGYEDVFVYKWGYPQLFRNIEGRRFEDITERAGLRHWMNSNGAVWFDYDRDGYLDLYVSEWGQQGASAGVQSHARLLRNNAGANPGHFTDVTNAAGVNLDNTIAIDSGGVPFNGVMSFSPRFSDLDNDGYPNLVIAADFSTSRLFWNNGDRTFTDATDSAGVRDGGWGWGTTWFDYDNDVDLDDLDTLSSNWMAIAGWIGGDFDGTGFVDIDDVLVICQQLVSRRRSQSTRVRDKFSRGPKPCLR